MSFNFSGAQRLPTVEGEILALVKVGADETKYLVVGAEGIFGDVVTLLHSAREPEIGAAGNGENQQIFAVHGEMAVLLAGSGANGAVAQGVLGSAVAAFS